MNFNFKKRNYDLSVEYSKNTIRALKNNVDLKIKNLIIYLKIRDVKMPRKLVGYIQTEIKPNNDRKNKLFINL